MGLVGLGLVFAAASLAIDLGPQGGWGARVFPLIGSVALIALGVPELVQARGSAPRLPVDADAPRELAAVAALLALSVAYVWAMARFGYLIPTALVAPAAMRLFGVRRPVWLLVAALAAPAAYDLIFFRALGVFPPLGDWFDLTDHLGF